MLYQLKNSLRKNKFLFQRIKAAADLSRPAIDFCTTHFGSRIGRRFDRASQYLTKNNIAGYIGWAGNGNMGDEALYEAFHLLFPNFSVLLYDRHPFELQLHRRFIAREPFYNFVALGGGTLFSYRPYFYQVDHALNHKHPLMTFGVGVEDPSFCKDERARAEQDELLRDWARLLKNQPWIFVRGPRTARVLNHFGLENVKIIGDPALSICKPRIKPRRTRLVGINVGCDGTMFGSQEQVNDAIVQTAIYLLDRGWSIEFLPMHKTDYHIGLSLARRLNSDRVSVLKPRRNPTELLASISHYDFLIGQRLHAVILACGLGIPSIGLEYRPKMGDFLESVGLPQFSLRTDLVTANHLISLIKEIDLKHELLTRQLIARCDEYRLLQRDAACRFVESIRSDSLPLTDPALADFAGEVES
jgi:hypothetical protein